MNPEIPSITAAYAERTGEAICASCLQLYSESQPVNPALPFANGRIAPVFTAFFAPPLPLHLAAQTVACDLQLKSAVNVVDEIKVAPVDLDARGDAYDATHAQPVRIWMVDDDDVVRGLLAELLIKQPGIECARQFDAPAPALAALEAEPPPDVVLLDLHIGRHNGLDAIRPIKARAPSTAVLMLTTFADSRSEERALSEGASGFLLKNYDPAEIAHVIRHAPGRTSDAQPAMAWRTPRLELGSLDSPLTPPARPSCAKSRGLFRGLLSLLAL